MYGYVWAITKVIFSYAGSPQVKISQKVLGRLLFWLTLYYNKTTGALQCHCG